MVTKETDRTATSPLNQLVKGVAVERKIYFYRIYSGVTNSGKPIPFDPVSIFTHIDGLAWNARYMFDHEDKYVACWVDRIERPCRVRVGAIRRSNLPLVEDLGNLDPLPIPETSGLAESIHAVFFENDIVGADYNYYGPRASKLADYITQIVKVNPPKILRFEPLLRKDAADQMKDMKRIRMFRLKIRSSYAETVARADASLGAAFKAAAEAGGADEIEIILKPQPYSRNALVSNLRETTLKLLQFKNLREESSKFYVEGYGADEDGAIKLDLLNDKFIVKKKIVKQDERSRALDPESAYLAIEAAYEALKGELVLAPTAG
jgi:hypothetical protein